MTPGSLLLAALTVAQFLLAGAMVCACLRLLRGPRAQDRVLALDTMYVNGMLIMLTFGMREASSFYFEAAAAIAVLGFVATAALARFLMRGETIE